MKRIFFLLSALAITSLSFAQAPQGINYQGVARTSAGAAISNTTIGVRFTIVQSGNTKYQENQSVKTDTFGLYSLVIGSPTATITQGSFAAIPWAGGNLSINVDIDMGLGFVPIASSQLQSVPYALYSGNSSSGITTITTNSTLATPTGTSTVGLSLAPLTPTVSGTYGGSTSIPQITVDQYGRVISASNQTFTTSGVTSVATTSPLTGTLTGGAITVGLGPVGAPTNTYGAINAFPIFQTDADGRVTGATTQTVVTSVNGTGSPVTVTTFSTGAVTVSTNTIIAANTVGSATAIPVITYDKYGRITAVGTSAISTSVGTVTLVTGSSPINVTNNTTTPVITIKKADTNNSGYLDSTDWNTFNNKISNVVTTGSGLTSANGGGTVTISANNGSPVWNANQLLSIPINNTVTATANQVLQFNVGQWAPATIPVLPIPQKGSLLYSNSSNIWVPTNTLSISSDGTSISVTNTTTVGTALTVVSTNTAASNAPALWVQSNTSTGYAIRADNSNGAAIVANSGGPYTINGNLSSGSGNALEGDLVNSTVSGNAVAGYIDTTSFGSAGYFNNDNPNNNARSVIEASTNGTGYTGMFTGGAGLQTNKLQVKNGAGIAGQVLTSDVAGNATWKPASGGLPPGVTGQTLYDSLGFWKPTFNLYNNGTNIGIGTTAPSALLDIQDNGGAAALNITVTGTSNAANFFINNAGSASNVVDATTNGSGVAINGFNNGSGNAGKFTVNNSSGANAAVLANTNSNIAPAITGVNTGTGPAIFSNGPLKLGGPIVDASGPGIGGDILTSQGGAGAIPKWMSATSVVSAGGGWSTGGNAISAGSFVGTTNLLPLVIGTTNTVTAQPIIFETGGTGPINEKMRIDAVGNVGIGTTTPISSLHVDNGFITTGRYGSVGSLILRSATGTKAVPTAISSANSWLGYISGRGYDGANYQETGAINFLSDGAITSSSSPGYFTIQTTPSGATASMERLRITSIGNVGIGTITPGSQLDVISTGTVATISGSNTGSAGSAGLFNISGAGNNNDVIKATTSNGGNAVVGINSSSGASSGGAGFFSTGAGNTANVLTANAPAGGGNSGNFTGGAGLKTDNFQMTNSPTPGAVLLSTNAAGNSAWAAPVNFSANSSATSVNPTTGTTIIFSVIDYNSGGGYVAATGIFTAPANGLYHFDAGVAMNITGGAAFDFELQLQGPTGIRTSTIKVAPSPSYFYTNVIAGNFYLNAGQTVKMAIYHDNASAISPVNSSSSSWFSGHLVH